MEYGDENFRNSNAEIEQKDQSGLEVKWVDHGCLDISRNLHD